MKKTTAEILLERSKYIISADLPSLSYQSKSVTIDYAANALNQSACYSGKQYREENIDFDQLHHNSKKLFAQIISSQIQLVPSQIQRLHNELTHIKNSLDFSQKFRQHLDYTLKVRKTLRIHKRDILMYRNTLSQIANEALLKAKGLNQAVVRGK